MRGEGQGVPELATDSVAAAVASANTAVVATSAHATWPSGAVAQCFPGRPPQPRLRFRSLREATEMGVISESLPFRFRCLDFSGGVRGVEWEESEDIVFLTSKIPTPSKYPVYCRVVNSQCFK